MKRYKAIILLMLCVSTNIFAQGDKEDMINSIKKSSKTYIFGEATLEKKYMADSIAFLEMGAKIEEWINSKSDKKVQKIVAKDIKNIVDTISYKYTDMNMYRSFVYVKKSNLIPIYEQEGYVIIDSDADDTPEKSSKTEKVKKTTAKNEKAKAEDKAANKGNDVKDEEDIAETQKQLDDMASELVDGNKSSKRQTANLTARDKKTLDKILAVNSFFDLKQVMEPMKDAGDITEYGKYATMEDPQESYLIVYDPAGNIRAVLDKENDEETRINLKTDEEDSLENYRGCGAIWFKLSNNK